jgi:cytoskeletal protein CcmA (bactofilin family)
MAMFEWETLSSTAPAAKNRTPASAGNGSDGAQSSIVLGPRDRLVGQLYVEGDLRVVGTVEGGLEVTGSVEIDDGGRVTGPVTAHDRLVVGRAGSLTGDVRVKRLVVQDGATFSGKVSMGKQVEAPPKPVELPAPVVEAVKVEEPVKAEAPVIAAEPVKAPEQIKAQPAKPQQFQAPKPPDRKGKRR